MLHQQHNIIISGGGTGGHLFPALAIADSLRKRLPDVKILFIGARGKMEMTQVPEAGYQIKGLWISGLQRKLTPRNLLFPLKVIYSLLTVNKIMRQFKPSVVVGTGGYASGPALRVASLRGIPTVIQEQNSYPGVTNRLLAKRAARICVAFEGMERYFPKDKICLTGNPVRAILLDSVNKKEEALSFFGLSAERSILLIVGGSQGALSINEGLKEDLEKFENQHIQVIWQTGKLFYPEAKKLVEEKHLKEIKVYEFIREMDLAYAAADAVISRAGAIAITELMITGKPAILVPLPSAAEDHQTKNAMSLGDHHAALLVRDDQVKEQLADIAINLLANAEERNKLTKNIITLARPDATERIVNEIMSLMETKNI